MLSFSHIALALSLTPVLTMAVPADVQGLDANAVNQPVHEGRSEFRVSRLRCAPTER